LARRLEKKSWEVSKSVSEKQDSVWRKERGEEQELRRKKGILSIREVKGAAQIVRVARVPKKKIEKQPREVVIGCTPTFVEQR